MKKKLNIAVQNMGDGSINIAFCNTREDALKILDSTEEEQAEGVPYEYGDIQEVDLEFDKDGNLISKEWINIDGIG